MRKLPQHDELLRECEKRGISIETLSSAHPGFFDDSNKEIIISNKTKMLLQQRIIEFDRARREARMWIIAVISMSISILSAATALFAVLR